MNHTTTDKAAELLTTADHDGITELLARIDAVREAKS